MYSIEIYYRTGNSFGCEDTQDTLGVSLESLEEAKLCLSYLKEHYEFVKKVNECNQYPFTKGVENKLRKTCETKPWYDVDGYPEGGFIFKKRRVSAFYLGYFDFETLHKAVIETENSDMSFTPGNY